MECAKFARANESRGGEIASTDSRPINFQTGAPKRRVSLGATSRLIRHRGRSWNGWTTVRQWCSISLLFLSFLFSFFLIRPTVDLHEVEGRMRRVKAVRSYLSGRSLCHFYCRGYTAGNIGRITGRNQPFPSLPFPPPFYTGVPAAVLHRSSPRNFQSLPLSPLSGGVEFHGIPLILGWN